MSLLLKLHAASEYQLLKDSGFSIPSQQNVNSSQLISNRSEYHDDDYSSEVQSNQGSNYSAQARSHSLMANHLSEDTGTSWVFVFDQLVNEIKIRHYSPKTLKAYRGYIRQLQTFTKSKDYQKLSQQDVIDFLTFLAVEKQVSAASQNLAFNSLLFLFKHVLKQEFGEIKGVVRAKRKPYIPVVLSRDVVILFLII